MLLRSLFLSPLEIHLSRLLYVVLSVLQVCSVVYYFGSEDSESTFKFFFQKCGGYLCSVERWSSKLFSVDIDLISVSLYIVRILCQCVFASERSVS